MSSKTASPTAHLLRNSRLFSLPPHLARAESRLVRVSDTATQPYPVQQAIATTPASRARGDWGFKRSLPRKQLRASNPVLRVNAIDTWENITDFESALDLTQTLQKFQELNLPVTTSARHGSGIETVQRSVFEEAADNTIPIPETNLNAFQRASSGTRAPQRWKFGGPWLAGMSEGDFVQYVNNKVYRRKGEFLSFVRNELKRKLESDRAHRATQAGVRGQAVDEGPIVVTDEEFEAHIRELRRGLITNSELARLVERFLDLPRITLSTPGLSALEPLTAAPPVTHPSAGLGYLRTSSFLSNHPILGPQAEVEPKPARVLGATRNAVDNVPGGVGLAGIVASGSLASNRIRAVDSNEDDPEMTSSHDKSGRTIGIGVPGGNTIWVEPHTVSIGKDGRVNLSIRNPTKTAVGIKTGELAAPDTVAAGYRREPAKPLAVLMPSAGSAKPRAGPKTDRPGRNNSSQRSGSGYGIDIAQDDHKAKAPPEDATSSLVQSLERGEGNPDLRLKRRR